MSHPATVVGIGALVVRPDGSLLLGHRTKAGETPTWCMPGGHAEPGETFEQGALRELAEESGLQGPFPTRAFVLGLDAPDGLVRVTVGVCVEVPADAVPEVAEPHVFERWVWVEAADAPEPLFSASRALLAAWLGRPSPPGWTLYALAGPDPAGMLGALGPSGAFGAPADAE